MIDVLQEWIRAHGAVGVFAFIAVENLGVPWPTILAFLVAIDLVNQGQLSLIGAIALCTAGHVAGSCASYALGRAGDSVLMRRLQRGSGMRRALERLDRWYASHGDITVFGARLVGQVRPWASFAAGLGNVRPLPFLAWTAVGSAIQVAITLKLTEVGFSIWDARPQLRLAMIIVIAVVFWGALLYGTCKHLRDRHRRRDLPDE